MLSTLRLVSDTQQAMSLNPHASPEAKAYQPICHEETRAQKKAPCWRPHGQYMTNSGLNSSVICL